MGLPAAWIVTAFLAVVALGAGDLDDARTVQGNVEQLTEDMVRELQRVEAAFAAKKLPLYAARNAKLSTVDRFWARVILNHPNHGSWVRGADREVLFYLQDVAVLPKGGAADGAEDSDLLHQYRVTLRFRKNPFFVDDVLWRDMDGTHDQAAKNDEQVSGIHWIGERRAYDRTSFFNFFEKKARVDQYIDPHLVGDLGHVIRYELWANPFSYFDANAQDDLEQRPQAALNLDVYGGHEPHTMRDLSHEAAADVAAEDAADPLDAAPAGPAE